MIGESNYVKFYVFQLLSVMIICYHVIKHYLRLKNLNYFSFLRILGCLYKYVRDVFTINVTKKLKILCCLTDSIKMLKAYIHYQFEYKICIKSLIDELRIKNDDISF